LIAALAVKLTSRGPIFFRQVRTGQFGRPFMICKFRTMNASNEGSNSFLTADGDPRITPVGKWLRKSKADELPQLFNVLAGNMSLVGPRPEVPQYTEKYTERQTLVFAMKPGITGPAANAYAHEEELLAARTDKESFYLTSVLPAKLEIDIVYCENVRLTEDLRLIFATMATIVLKVSELGRPSLGSSAG